MFRLCSIVIKNANTVYNTISTLFINKTNLENSYCIPKEREPYFQDTHCPLITNPERQISTDYVPKVSDMALCYLVAILYYFILNYFDPSFAVFKVTCNSTE